MTIAVQCTVCETPGLAEEEVLDKLPQPLLLSCTKCRKNVPWPVIKALYLMNWRVSHIYEKTKAMA
jgi:hypothetical protein